MKFSTLIIPFLLAIQVKAQVTIGNQATVTLRTGADLYTDGIHFLPSSVTGFEKNFFQKVDAPDQMRGSIYSIAQVISFSDPVLFSGTLRLSYAGVDLNGNLESDLGFSFKTNGVWRFSTMGTVNLSQGYVEATLTNQAFESFTLSNSFSTLPVSMLSFTASLQTNGQVLLQWQTGNETNNSHFTIERSYDGTYYTSLGTVKADAANGRGRYVFTDLQPATGNNYYRLRQHDLDGAEKLHGVRIINTVAANRTAIITPNPVISDGFLLDLRKAIAKPMTYFISNTGGQTVKNGQVSNQQNWISVSNLPTGTYILRLADGQTIRFQKQ
jgi:hypothetical protein